MNFGPFSVDFFLALPTYSPMFCGARDTVSHIAEAQEYALKFLRLG